MDGADYVKNILTPVDLETILLLTRSGWAADRVFRLAVNKINGINNASEASGPTPGSAPEYKKFLQVASTLKKLQQEDSFTLGYRLEDDSSKLGFLIKPSQRNNKEVKRFLKLINIQNCLLYTSPSPRDQRGSRMPSSA